MTATTLRTIAQLWPALNDALAAPTQHSWPPVELRGYLDALEQYDIAEAAALRALERSPDQLGTRPVPINLRVHDTMRAVEAALLDTADRIAWSVQRTPMQPPPPARAAYARSRADRVYWEDRARRAEAARKDAADGRRWRHNTGRTAIRAAVWLAGRVEGARGPFRPLSEPEQHHVARVAEGALARIEATLDLADGCRELTSSHPCPCGGTIEVYGGAGAQPVARCKSCGAIWSEAGVVAA
ncbi:hypothetical protein [Streptomyces sp. NPDC013457]|uniref:hypothetical protein n=1 Tax=Streptomyces sp. NPDC013457 TaxID=3364866 RepID=UPI003702C855